MNRASESWIRVWVCVLGGVGGDEGNRAFVKEGDAGRVPSGSANNAGIVRSLKPT